MRPARHASGRFFAALFTALVFILGLGVTASARDPYDGGTRLPAGGGEPGKAYKELLDAAGRKDFPRVCRLATTNENELRECLKDRKAAEAIVFFLGDPRGQKILDGYTKGDDATLEVAYPHAGAPDSHASVRMKKTGGKWIWAGFSASGSGEASASASGTKELGAPPKAEAQASSPKDCPMLGKWEFAGNDDTGAAWKGEIDIRIENEEVACDVNIQGPKFSTGIGGPFECKPGQRNFECATAGNSFTAVLSADGKSLANGKWTTKADDFMKSPKITGAWSAKPRGR